MKKYTKSHLEGDRKCLDELIFKSSAISEFCREKYDSSPFNCFVLHDENALLTVYNVIVDPSLPVLEPSLNYNSIIFDEWFGTPFTYSHHTTHIRTPHPSKK